MSLFYIQSLEIHENAEGYYTLGSVQYGYYSQMDD